MIDKRHKYLALGLLASVLTLAGCRESGDDIFLMSGAPAPIGETSVIDASAVSDEFLAELDVVSNIIDVTIDSPPEVLFTLETSTGVPIVGIVPFWEDSSRYVRFTLAKLVPGMDGDPNTWVSYTRDEDSNAPDYDTGDSLVDHGDGSYTFTFSTDVTVVPGVPYEPELTHRLGGQLGSGSVSLEAQNFAYDFVPDGGPVMDTRNIAVMNSCNECHDDLVFHGRRFMVEYCVTCHNPDLAMGEGNFGFMIHKIHSGGDFAVLDGGISYAELTYPQDVANCRKCHNDEDAVTPDANNWKTLPNFQACFGCHEESDHPPGIPTDNNEVCTLCHTEEVIEADHATPNATPNNPDLRPDQRNITYELLDAAVDMMNEVTINARILSDGMPIDVANLPADLAAPGRYPGFVLAWALPQDGIDEPQDYNNFGRRAAQPLSLSLEDFVGGDMIGTHTYDDFTGVNTFVVTDIDSQFPATATLRAVGLQGYFQQEFDEDTTYSLHTPSMVVAVTGDDERRMVVDSDKCSSCHEWFEGHGGNRVLNMQICTLCHVPNLSSSGRTVVDPALRGLDLDIAAAVADGSLPMTVDPDDPLTYPEDAQNFKSLVHGIHSSGFRSEPFQHVRGPSRQGLYDWSHVTFPRGASTNKCSLCHDDDTHTLPLPEDVLATTVRTTGVTDGQDLDAEAAFVNVPNLTDHVHSPVAAVCVGCHTDEVAMAHIGLNGGQVSKPPFASFWTNRFMLVPFETCEICHGPGRIADIDVVHDR